MKTVFMVFLILLLFSCKKEDNYQTIYPLPYLPVYPGSRWVYLTQNGDTVIHTTESAYKLDSYTCSVTAYNYNGDNVHLNTDPVYVPVWNGTPIYGYSTPGSDFWSGQYRYGYQVGILSEISGKAWNCYNFKFGSVGRQVIGVDMTLLLNSATYYPVIKVSEYYYQHLPTQDTIWEADRYYAKNIGLVYQVSRHDTIELISYYINR